MSGQFVGRLDADSGIRGKMRRMAECAKADYQARFLADWNHQELFGERRRAARV